MLKGPQGSLYGRNAVAGAINLISAKPNPDEYFGKIEAGFGSFGQRELQGYVNIPLDDLQLSDFLLITQNMMDG